MLRDRSCKRILRVDGFEVEFSLADKGTAVSSHGSRMIFGSHGYSWETMVTSRALVTSTVRATSLLMSSPSFQRLTSSQVSK